MLKTLNSSNEWYVTETIIKISDKRYYIWTLIDFETRFVINWFLTSSRQVSSTFHLFTEAIVSDEISSYTIPTKVIFNKSKHIKVITNNLIENFFKRSIKLVS